MSAKVLSDEEIAKILEQTEVDDELIGSKLETYSDDESVDDNFVLCCDNSDSQINEINHGQALWADAGVGDVTVDLARNEVVSAFVGDNKNTVFDDASEVDVGRDPAYNEVTEDPDDDNNADNNHRVISRDVNNKQKTFARRPLVNSIENALDESNYDPHYLPEEEQLYKVIVKKKTSRTPEISKLWTNNRPPAGKFSPERIILSLPEVKNEAASALAPFTAWKFFISNEIIDIIVSSTNELMKDKIELVQSSGKTASFYYVHETDPVEITAFVGMLYLRGLLGMNDLCAKLLFNEKVGPPAFVATMSINRFRFLYTNICFDDISTRKDRWPHDRFAAIRTLHEEFNKNCSSAVNPNDYLSFGEILYPCRSQVAFKQYNSNKPAKYGLLYKSINSSRYPYTFRSIVYCGKPEREPTPHYVAGIMTSVKKLVEELEVYSSLHGLNISMNRLYTSFDLFEWLLSKHITAIGTLMSNKKGIPPQITSVQGREANSYNILWELPKCKLSLHSYVMKSKSKGMKNVLTLSTVPALLGVTRDDGKQKPALFKLYDFTKGGTDIVDQRMRTYTTNTKSDRWPMTAFSYVLDTARVNSQTLWALNNGKTPSQTNSFDYGYDLALSLLLPLVERRNTKHMSASLKLKIQSLLEDRQPSHIDAAPPTAAFPKYNQARKRCARCMEEVREEDDRRAKTQRLTLLKQSCQTCGKPICDNHSILQCHQCKS
uniref:PiggyBac transposable element-derived protein 3-like n=2 Tax=Hirondellea gigas TaxID=1518452 RepID=A0A6A7G5I7_9CRUS